MAGTSAQGTPIKQGVREGHYQVDRHRTYTDPGGTGPTDPANNPNGPVGGPQQPTAVAKPKRAGKPPAAK